MQVFIRFLSLSQNQNGVAPELSCHKFIKVVPVRTHTHTHPSTHPSHPPLPHSSCQIKCQTDQDGLHLQRVYRMTVWYSTFQSGVLLLHLPPHLHPSTYSSSLVADWVVIVIKRSCTSRENTKTVCSRVVQGKRVGRRGLMVIVH